MNLIAMINSDKLYERSLKEQIPYFKFSSWIESTVQKEIISHLFKTKGGEKRSIPDDLILEDKKKGAASKNQSQTKN